jgi:TPR repeat protein
MKPQNSIRGLLISFSIVGIIASIFTVNSIVRNLNFICDAIKVDGIVIENIESGDVFDGEYVSASVVAYKDSKGETQSFQSERFSPFTYFKVGEHITVLASMQSHRAVTDFGHIWITTLTYLLITLTFGGGALGLGVSYILRARLVKLLKETGLIVKTSDFEIKINHSHSVDSQFPYFLECRALVYGVPRIFKSDDLWTIPQGIIEGKQIRIYYMWDDLEKYWVDTEFLDQLPKADTAEAFGLIQKAAKQENALVQCNLGVKYDNGTGNNKDEAEAVFYWRKAADKGVVDAQYKLGVMYRDGAGVRKDESEAVRLIRKGAGQGDALAQNNLGVMYRDGAGVGKDVVEAVRWWRRAADQGDAFGQRNLGNMYAVGKDLEKAVLWWRKAAKQGDALAQDKLSAMYRDGSGVGKEETEVGRWWRKVADQGNTLAQNNLIGTPIEKFDALCQHVADSYQSLLSQDKREPLYEQILEFLMSHEADHDQLVKSITGIMFRYRETPNANKKVLPVTAIEYCMHALRWPEVYGFAKSENRDFYAQYRDPFMTDIMHAFHDEWPNKVFYRRFGGGRG